MVIRIIRVVDYYVGIPTCFVIGILDKFLNVFRKSVVTTNPEKILLIKKFLNKLNLILQIIYNIYIKSFLIQKSFFSRGIRIGKECLEQIMLSQ